VIETSASGKDILCNFALNVDNQTQNKPPFADGAACRCSLLLTNCGRAGSDGWQWLAA
jgi:hypothetical protein